MTSFLNLFRRADTRAFLACWVLLAYMVRALVPVGFMPDLKALQHGVLEIVICTADGTGKLLVDHAPAKGEPSYKAGADACAFGGTPQAALISFIPLLILPFLLASAAIARNRYVFWSARLRTPLSPRAPPFLLTC